MRETPESSASTPRRRFLGQASRLTLGLVLVSANRPAAAFQTMPAGDYSALVEQACGATADHARQLADAAARLGVTLSEDQKQAALQALRCPVCGCSLAGNDGLAGSNQGHGS